MRTGVFLGTLAAAVGTAALLVLSGGCEGPPESDTSMFSTQADPGVDESCLFCVFFDMDPEGDED